jgi:hypothetical protein
MARLCFRPNAFFLAPTTVLSAKSRTPEDA